MTLLKEKASDHTIFSYLEMLKNKKKLTMRNGSFGLVLIPQSRKYVYRIWADDPAYDEWVKIMIKNQDNLAVPEVFRKVKTITGKFLSGTVQLKVMKMEYLYPLSNTHVELTDKKTDRILEFPLSVVATMIYRDKSRFLKEYIIMDDQLEIQYADLYSLFGKLSKVAGVVPDFTTYGNILQRQNGEYVISDPIATTYTNNIVRLPTIKDADYLHMNIPLSVERILRIQSPLARSQAIQKYDFTEDEIKQLMSDPKIKAEVQIELQRKYGDRAKQYSHLNSISMDDLEGFMKEFYK
jgi:hypothetical protein